MSLFFSTSLQTCRVALKKNCLGLRVQITRGEIGRLAESRIVAIVTLEKNLQAPGGGGPNKLVCAFRCKTHAATLSAWQIPEWWQSSRWEKTSRDRGVG